MTGKMIMTSGFPELTAMINSIAEELKIDITIVEGILNEAAQEVKNLVSNDSYEVVISRAGTAKAISEVINLPIVYSDSSEYDLLLAFRHAKKIGDKICFITYPEEGFPFKMDYIMDTLGFEIELLFYENWDELYQQIKCAEKMGMDVVVGGGIRAREIVTAHGMHSIQIMTNERNIRRTLMLARKIAQDHVYIKDRAERLNAVINVSEEGVIFLNRSGQIESCNPAAEKIFGIKEYLLVGKSMGELTNNQLIQLLNNKKIFIDKGSLTYENIIVNYEPLIVGNERVGTLLVCREFEKIQKLESTIRKEVYSKGLVARFTLDDIQYTSEKMKSLVTLAREYATTNSTVLIIGESGTGKELIAQGIHNASSRKDGPFVAVNCAALPESLLESELFGYAVGAFTGAKKGGHQGVFELAHNGTIFLDEIGEIPLFIQTRLLRVLQEKEVMRIGGDRITPVNIRIIAATNQKLWNLVKEGKFRLDLYFRLSVLHMEIPPLRHRKMDIPSLVNNSLINVGSNLSYEDFSDKLQSFFMNYSWPGNIRELENIIERFHLRVRSEKEEEEFIKHVLRETEEPSDTIDDQHSIVVNYGTMNEIEKQIITKMLEMHENNRTIVAEKLGISRTTIWKKLNE